MAIECRATFYCNACKMARELGPCEYSFPIRTMNNIPPPDVCPYAFTQARWKGEMKMVMKEKVQAKDRADGYQQNDERTGERQAGAAGA
jgi:hypothetical protein